MRFSKLAFAVLLFTPTTAVATCGEKGGPGYRGPTGKCVSWQQIGPVCGSPPETHCTPEMPHKDAEGAARSAVAKPSLDVRGSEEKR